MDPIQNSIRNPKYNAIFFVLLIVIIFLIGFFLYKNIGNRNNINTGRVTEPASQIREHLEILGAKGQPLWHAPHTLILSPTYQTDNTAQIIKDNLTYAHEVLTAGRALDPQHYPYVMFPPDAHIEVKNSVVYLNMERIGGGLNDKTALAQVESWVLDVANSWRPNPLILYDVEYAVLKVAWGGDPSSDVEDTTAPVLSGITTTPSKISATIKWYANEVSSSLLEYGTSQNLGTTTPEGPLVSPGSLHSVVIKTPLLSNTLYYFKAESRDKHGNLGKSALGTFRTLP